MPKDESDITRTVRSQYEALPYPPRDPQDETRRLIPTSLDHLSLINHYCFRGRQDFRKGFRVLVAGGGTGDATVFLAEQLKDTDARVVHLDLSETSMAVAKARTEIRGLTNVEWVRGSLLDLPDMGLKAFDYINCCGVLHHLEHPDNGLQALRSVVRSEGALSLMVYGKYGRAGVYQLQELLRIVNADADDATRLTNAKVVLAALPPTNWFRRTESFFLDHRQYGDAGVYDLLLHSTDRAYSIPELYALLDGCGVHLATFDATERSLLTSGVAYQDPKLAELLAPLPVRDRQAVLELLGGVIFRHILFATVEANTVASPDHLDNTPFFHLMPGLGRVLHEQAHKAHGPGRLTVNLQHGHSLSVPVGRYTAPILKHLDGRTSVRDIVKAVREEHPSRPSRDDVLAEFRALYDVLSFWDLLLLRHSSVDPPEPIPLSQCESESA
ncbi:MAG TPA: methyltransferase [Phycisphaerae bacterium]|nr:methyltransferase [Phycisphaerae bacterium]